jgi:cytochrome P450
LPFSTGAKGCPASGFALHEMRVLLVMLLQRFELAGAPGGGVLCTPRVVSS